jgi:hypothetical protein
MSDDLTVTGVVHATKQFLGNSNDTAALPSFTFLQDSNTGMYQIGEGILGISTNGVERMRCDGTGIVGIGSTITSKGKLNVGGVISAYPHAVAGEARYHLYNAGGIAEWRIGQRSNNMHNCTINKVLGGNEYEYLTVGTTGNVGISSSNPSYTLDVNGSARFVSNTYTSGTNNMVLMDDTSSTLLGGALNGWQNAALITMNGRSKPTTGGFLGLSACDNGYMSFSMHDSAGTGTEWMRLTGDGKLGVGMINPSCAFDVAGAMHGASLVTDSNVTSKAWVVGPTMMLNGGWMDLTTGTNTYTLSLEPGNTGAAGGAMFHQGFLNGTDNSGDGLAWTTARLLIRGCRTGTNTTPSTCTADVRIYSSNAWTTAKKPDGTTNCTMSLTDFGSSHGYTTNVSPPFKLLAAQLTDPVLGIRISSPSGVTYRCGPVYLTCYT